MEIEGTGRKARKVIVIMTEFWAAVGLVEKKFSLNDTRSLKKLEM